jgi:hypothetical protein
MPIAPAAGAVQRSCFCSKKWLFKALSFDIQRLILTERWLRLTAKPVP